MKKTMKFYEINEKETATMVLLLKGISERCTSTGKPYASLQLFDGVKVQSINDFRNVPCSLAARGIVTNSIVVADITKQENGYFSIGNIRLNEDSSITLSDFVHTAPIDFDKAFRELLGQIRSVDTHRLASDKYKSITCLTSKLLLENEKEFKHSSAAVSMHHNFLGGLLYHTVRMVSVAKQIAKTYCDVDEELLVCGTALHDIGKLRGYTTDEVGEAKVSVDGNLFEHAYLGMCMVDEAAREENYDPERIRLLKHMIASHHGKLEWGALITPKIMEASILHNIDMMDSRINMFEEAYKGQEEGTMSDNKVYGLDNSYIYRPKYSEHREVVNESPFSREVYDNPFEFFDDIWGQNIPSLDSFGGALSRREKNYDSRMDEGTYYEEEYAYDLRYDI